MISLNASFPKRNWIPFLLALVFLCVSQSMAQTNQTIYVTVNFWKVTRGQGPEFEKLFKENIKPVQQLRKQNGKIINWRLFAVHGTGAEDEYNYVGVSYYDSWEKTEPNENIQDLLKAANPKADAATTLAKIRATGTIVRRALLSRADFVEAKNPVPFKYILVNFMSVNNGMFTEYLKAEKEDWKPIHQALVDGGSRAGWNLWELVLPGGTANAYDYVTANIYSDYKQINNETYQDAFKKVYPEKNIQEMFDQTAKCRDMVRAELWELIDSL